MPPLLLLHLLTLFLFPAASQGDPADDTYDRNMCLQSNYTCGKVDIHYPFYLSNSKQELSGDSNSSYCAYPGMAIMCEGDTATLQLSSNNSYTVQDINYDNYTISLAYTGVFEGGDCPRVLRNVTIPSRPASWPSLAPSPSMTTTYFFFHCALTPDFPKPPTIYEMACGNFDQGSEISFVLPEHYVPPKNLSQVCKEVWEVPVPRHSIPFPLPVRWGDDGYGGVLKRGFQLVWDSSVAAQCTQCEHSDGGQCGYNGEGQFIGCFCPGGGREAQHCGQKSSKKRIIISGDQSRLFGSGTGCS